MRPAAARNALWATHGGLSLEWCAVLCTLSPMALYRLVCAFGHHSLVTVLPRCDLPLPAYFLADEKHRRCLTETVSRPTMVSGRGLWPLGYTTEASATAFPESSQVCQRAASQQEPSSRVQGGLTDGFDSTTTSRRTLFPGVHVGPCLRHALLKLPKKLVAIASAVRKALRTQFHPLWDRARQRKHLRVLALGQRLRRFADHVTHPAGEANGHRVRQWFQAKQAGWYAVLEEPQMPVTSTLLEQVHNAIDRNRFMMQGCHHPDGRQQAFLTGLAHLYTLVPYQRRARHASQWGVEVEGGKVPTSDWFLNRQILTSGGFRCAVTRFTTSFGGMWDFLAYLETERGNSPSTRTTRLAAITSFMRFVEYRVPSILEQSRRVLAIPTQKTPVPLVKHLSMTEMQAILDAPALRTRSGLRDRAMLHLCFAAGLRGAELLTLPLTAVTFHPAPAVRVLGKGRRDRSLPLWNQTVDDLRAWVAVRGEARVPELFLNAQGRGMTREGFAYLLRTDVRSATQSCPSLAGKHVTPHVFRHTCAMMILQATGDLRKVSLWWGHADMQTTEASSGQPPRISWKRLKPWCPRPCVGGDLQSRTS